ncbi:MAG: diphthine--ammonia ligase [Candidatus Aenigmarchaeota archaeon]|nr:diphthine--ammonia ligase [Candidatus Aenigmarchaeota archaeon]
MKLAILYSGGKDSTLTAYRALQDGHQIVRLIAFQAQNPESYMFHYPNIHLAELQAKAMGFDLLMQPTAGIKELDLQDIKAALSSIKGIQGVGAGALASAYQYERVKAICHGLGLQAYAPLWHIDPRQEWQELLDSGFRVIITSVAADGLGRDWLGKEITKQSFKQLEQASSKHGFHLGGEGGEFETLVIDAPLFRQRLEVLRSSIAWNGETDSGLLKISRAELVEK